MRGRSARVDRGVGVRGEHRGAPHRWRCRARRTARLRRNRPGPEADRLPGPAGAWWRPRGPARRRSAQFEPALFGGGRPKLADIAVLGAVASPDLFDDPATESSKAASSDVAVLLTGFSIAVGASSRRRSCPRSRRRSSSVRRRRRRGGHRVDVSAMPCACSIAFSDNRTDVGDASRISAASSRAAAAPDPREPPD